MRKLMTLTVLLLFGFSLYSQDFDLHVPREFKEAYKNGTRDLSGKPGENYWHNTVDYNIEVTVDPETRGISGTETITYYNNSPDRISSIVIHLYYDVFKEGNERGMQVNPEDIGNGVEISNLKIGEQDIPLNNQQIVNRRGTQMGLRLLEPLEPGSSVKISMDWEQKVPLTLRRTGVKDSTTFFIAYWYPQVAVYDDIFGWDQIDYTFDTEFYNNLGNYDVTINAPDNFLVWATGELQNAGAILPDEILSRYEKAKTSDETIHVVDSTDLKNLKLKSGTWHFTANEVSDFAFAISDHYSWDAASEKVEGKPVFISSVFPYDKSEQYAELTAIQQKTMRHFSEDIPGVPYPYPAFTTFIGLNGGGMEFPMMANNASSSRGLAIHEMMHTYFPMYVRINEKRWAWMDEGWASFVPPVVTHKFFENKEGEEGLLSRYHGGMNSFSGSIESLPTITSSQHTGRNYGYQSYTLPSFTYAVLYHYLGEEVFLKCFRAYINRWAKKSPTPYDFIYTFEDVSGEDLNWFWEPWYFEFGHSNIAIKELNKGNMGTGKLVVENLGTRPVPLTVNIEYEDGTSEYFTMDAKEWIENKNEIHVKLDNFSKIQFISVNNDVVDSDFSDNIYPTLSDQYKEIDLSEQFFGTYKINEYQITVELSFEDDAMKLTIPEINLSEFMRPLSETTFASLDNRMVLELSKEENATNLTLELKQFGVTATGTKQ